jgi:hypothetical protein
VGKKHTFIDINGQRIDASSGKPLATAAHRINTRKPAQGRTPVHDMVRQPARPLDRHAPKSSQTLMRKAVKKPAAPVPKPGKVADIMVMPAAKIQKDRQLHAQRIQRSKLISHFSPQSQQVQPITPAALPTPPAPTPTPAPTPAATKPVPERPSAKHTKEAVLQRALERADSHTQPAHKTPERRGRRKAVVAAAVIGIALLGVGVVGFQNPDTVKLAVISAKAGFRANTPSQQVAGYSLNHAAYGDGTVALQYCNDKGQTYTITEKRSNVGADGLREQFTNAVEGTDYKVVSAGGKQVYLYGDQDASWIDNGIWYVIQSDGALTDQQLTKLAAGL